MAFNNQPDWTNVKSEDAIEIKITRKFIEDIIGYKFTNSKWEEYKACNEVNIGENLEYEFECLAEHYIDRERGYYFRPEIQTDKDYWSQDEKEHVRLEKVRVLKEKNIPNIFATKIQQFYLKAKYNPRTKIGKKFINDLYNQNFTD